MGTAPRLAPAPNLYFTVFGRLGHGLPGAQRRTAAQRRQSHLKLMASCWICLAAKYRTLPDRTNYRKS